MGMNFRLAPPRGCAKLVDAGQYKFTAKPDCLKIVRFSARFQRKSRFGYNFLLSIPSGHGG
jgi:hypothetical protein